MVWGRTTYRDGKAVCEGIFYTAWRSKVCGEYEVRHLYRAPGSGPVTFAKINQSWTHLPIHWEVI